MRGFLGTQATPREDFNLLIQIAMAFALVLGMALARKKKFQAHKYCQSSVMVLNLFLIFFIMFPSFRRQVIPHFSEVFHDPYYRIAAIHAGLGIAAEALGLYIVLAAGTTLFPAALRFKRYKPWMRAELLLWWVVLSFGISTYGFWYVFPHRKATAAVKISQPLPLGRKAAAVTLRNFEFTPKEITVPAGSIVKWSDEGGRHKIVADDNTFESPVLFEGDHYQHPFEKPGVFPYHCDFHGDRGGKDMAGVVKVIAP